jgi:hypothetical protein
MGWVWSFTLLSLYHWKTGPYYPINRRLGASQNWSGCVKKYINLFPLSEIEPRFLRKSTPQFSHYTDWAIQDPQNASIAREEREKQWRESAMIGGIAIGIWTKPIEKTTYWALPLYKADRFDVSITPRSRSLHFVQTTQYNLDLRMSMVIRIHTPGCYLLTTWRSLYIHYDKRKR